MKLTKGSAVKYETNTNNHAILETKRDSRVVYDINRGRIIYMIRGSIVL